MHRAELHAALLEALPASTIRLGARCVAVAEESSRVVLQFADGTREVADAVIGADGIDSLLIRATIADDTRRFGGMHTFRGVVPMSRLPAHHSSELAMTLWCGPHRSMVSYPVSANRLMNFAGAFPAEGERDESWTSEGRVEQVLSVFQGWHEELRALIGAAERLIILPLYDRLPLERWGDGRITLLGDAAHPMFPFMAQGANQAIEDAFVLARCLAGVDSGGISAALRTYEAQRIARTGKLQGDSAKSPFLLADGEAQRERDNWFAYYMFMDDQMWLYGYDADRDDLWDA